MSSIAPIFVSTQWLADHLSAPDVVVVDGSWYLPAMARDPAAEFLAGHIPGAVRFDIDAVSDTANPLPHMLPDPVSFASAMRKLGIGDGMTIVVYDGAGLFSAQRVRWALKAFGARDVMLLEGGLPKWTAEGRPLEDGPATPRKHRHFTARFDHSVVADFAAVKAALEAGSAQVIDARPAGRFAGVDPEPREGVPSGHMPGARNLPGMTLVADGRLKSKDEIEALLREAGVDLSRPVITSCGSGVTAALISVALESIGRPAQALYDGAWTEWATTPGAPIAQGPA